MRVPVKAKTTLSSAILITVLMSISVPANALDFGSWRYGNFDFSRFMEKFAKAIKRQERLVTEEAARIAAEEDSRLAAEEAARIAAEEEARLAAEEAARVAAEEETRLAVEEAARIAAEEEARLAAEEAARITAEEEARLAAEEAARITAEEEIRLAAEEAARIAAEEETRLAAEEAARLVAEEESRLAAEQAADSSVALSWTFPTVRADGSQLSAAEISGFEIYYYREGDSESEGSVVDVPALDGDSNSVSEYIATELSSGTYHFAIAAYDNDALYSNLSSEVSVVIAP
jgi:uncharacterized protein (DUF2345 family)